MLLSEKARITTVGGSQLLELIGPISLVYNEAFTAPPYNEPPNFTAWFRRHLARMANEPTARVVVANVEERLVGFAYGLCYEALPSVAPHFEKSLADNQIWLSEPPFLFQELAVASSCRGQGIGVALHDELMTQTPRRRALLVVHPQATAAQRLYLGRGWQILSRSFPSASGETSWVMGLDRPQE